MRRLRGSLSELSFTLNDSAFIVLNTSASYTVLVSMLNRLFLWHLSMLRMIPFTCRDFGSRRDGHYPVFMYNSVQCCCTYLLICDPAMGFGMGSVLDGYNAMLIVVGADAFSKQMKIYEDLTDISERICQEGDVRAREHEDLRRLVKKDLIVSCDYMSFQHCEGADRSMEEQITKISVTSISQRSKTIYTKAGNVDMYRKEKEKNVYGRTLSLFGPVPGEGEIPEYMPQLQPKTSMLSLEGLEGKRREAALHRLSELQDTSRSILNVLYSKFII